MSNVDKLRASIIDPARTNQFRVTVTFPQALNINGKQVEQAQVLARTVNIPEAEIGEIRMMKGGKPIKFAGDRDYGDVSIDYRVDLNYAVHDLFLGWSDYIVSIGGFGANRSFQDYTADVVIEALRQDDSDTPIVTKEWILRDVWPKNVSQIDMDDDSENQAVEFQITLAIKDYEYRTVSTV